jgi:hypothetical protein
VETGRLIGRLDSAAIFFVFEPSEGTLRLVREDEVAQRWTVAEEKVERLASLADLPSESDGPEYWVINEDAAVIQSGSFHENSDLSGTRAWDWGTGSRLPELESPEAFQAVSRDGHRRARLAEQTTPRVWTDDAMDAVELAFANDRADPDRMQVSDDGRYLALSEVEGSDGRRKVRLIDLTDRREMALWSVDARPNCLVIAPSAKHIAVCEVNSVQFYEVGTDTPRLTLTRDRAPVAAAFDADNAVWAVAYDHGEIVLMRAVTGTELIRLATGSERMTTMGISQKGQWLVAGNANGGIVVWNLARLRADMQSKNLGW